MSWKQVRQVKKELNHYWRISKLLCGAEIPSILIRPHSVWDWINPWWWIKAKRAQKAFREYLVQAFNRQGDTNV